MLVVKLSFNPCFNGTYSLTSIETIDKKVARSSFNPCFNGTYSLTLTLTKEDQKWKISFNPCFNGTYSLTGAYKNYKVTTGAVLILVLMELTL